MGFKAITVNTPSTDPAHIYSADDAALYSSIIGTDCILDIGSKMAASIISNNIVRISDGACLIQGHFGRIPFGEYEDMTINNGTVEQMRNDIIVARFTTTSSGEIETYELAVLEGTPGATATDPVITVGDLEAGDFVREYPLYRVKISGLSITAIESRYQIVSAINTLTKFQVAGGTATVITLENISFIDGSTATFIVITNNNSTATTINSKSLYKPNTTETPKLIAGKAVTVWYDEASDCFFIKASAEGDAVAADVLAGNTFSNDDDIGIVGTMPENGSVGTQNLTTEGAEYAIPEGHHNGLGKVKAVITGLIAGVIKAGTTVGGILGTFTSDATGTATRILSGYTAYVNGSKITGTIASKAAQTFTPSTVNQTIASGQYLSGTQTILGDADLVPANILQGKNIFGVAGGVVTGKKYASGLVTLIASDDKYFGSINSSGAVIYFYDDTVLATITGLSFTPSIVRVYIEGTYYIDFVITNKVGHFGYYGGASFYGLTSNDSYITSSGFVAYLNRNNYAREDIVCTWHAWE